MTSTVELTSKPYLLGPDDGVADLWWPFSAGVGRYTHKAIGAATENRLFQMVVSEPCGAAPPLHVHRDADETFYMLEGELTFYAAGEQLDARAGDFVVVPKGCVHSFLVRSPQARMFVTFGPAGVEGFFTELGIDAEGDKPPAQAPDPERFARVADRYGMDIVGPPPISDSQRPS